MSVLRATVLLGLITTSLPAVADFAGVQAGGGTWQPAVSGELGRSEVSLNGDLGLDEESNSFAFISVEHPLPFLPNVKIQHSEMAWAGSALISAGTTLNDVTFTSEQQADVLLDLGHTDVTMYYEGLDGVVDLDLGLTARMYDGEARLIGASEQETAQLDTVVPLLFGRAGIDLPFTGLSAHVSGNWMNADEFQLVDWSAEFMYETQIFPAVGAGLIVGYRSQLIQLDEDLDDLRADATIDGVFVALQIHL